MVDMRKHEGRQTEENMKTLSVGWLTQIRNYWKEKLKKDYDKKNFKLKIEC